MMKKNQLAEWENALNLMTDEELQFIVEHQVDEQSFSQIKPREVN